MYIEIDSDRWEHYYDIYLETDADEVSIFHLERSLYLDTRDRSKMIDYFRKLCEDFDNGNRRATDYYDEEDEIILKSIKLVEFVYDSDFDESESNVIAEFKLEAEVD